MEYQWPFDDLADGAWTLAPVRDAALRFADDRTFREGLHHKRDALTQVVTKLDEAVRLAESGEGGDEARVITIRWTIATDNPAD